MRQKESRPTLGRSQTAAVVDGKLEEPSVAHYRRNRERVQLYRDDGKEVAGITGDTLHKTIIGSIHRLRKPPAICFDVGIIKEAQAERVRLIEVYDSETGELYSVTLARFLAHAFPVFRGHGDQLGLRLADWIRDDEPTIQQLSMWDGKAA